MTLAFLLFQTSTGLADNIALVLDPKFYWTPVHQPVPNSTKTVIGFYHQESGRLTAYKPDEAKHLDLMEQSGLTTARSVLARTDPFVVRDRHGVIQALRFASDDPAITSIVLLPELANRFAVVLGPGGCYAAVPNRETVYLFPRLSTPLRTFSLEILNQYHNSSWPVSTELFELSKETGLKQVGEFKEDL